MVPSMDLSQGPTTDRSGRAGRTCHLRWSIDVRFAVRLSRNVAIGAVTLPKDVVAFKQVVFSHSQSEQ